MKFSIVYKFALSFVLLVLISTSVVGALFYARSTDLLVERALDEIAGKVQEAGNMLKRIISVHDEDVLFLSNTPPIQGLLRAKSSAGYDVYDKASEEQWLSRLGAIFTSHLQRKSNYLTIRFIDKDGRELVHVRREGDEIVNLGADQLQNKAKRVYVRETLKLAAGSVYVSEINLNREFGVVTEPYQEVLRSATPIYDEQTGELAGLIAITAEIGSELRTIQNLIRDTSSNEIYITNDHGGFLLHSDKDKIYGFDLGNRYRIQEEIPPLAKLFLPDNHDRQMILMPDDTDGQQVVNFTKVAFDSNNPARFIAVVITQNYESIVVEQSRVLDEVMILSSLLALLGALLGALLSIRLTRPIARITQVMDDYTHQRKATVKMPVKMNDEIGVLAQSYEVLINQVEDAQAKLEDMNDNLGNIVTERTHDLELSEQRQRSIVENMIDGLITIDDKGIVLSMNPAAVTIFGYQQKEVLGNNINILMPEPYHSEHDGYMQHYQQTGEKKIIGVDREVEGQRKDGSCFPMELAVSEIIINGQKSYTGQVRDITERKLVDKMKTEFISTVSHELRTPLTSIRGSLGLITGGAVGELPEQAKDLLRIAGNNTERLLLLINDILDIQKIESGEMVFNFQTVELMTIIEQAVEDNAAYGDQHGVKFKIANDLSGARVYVDKDRLMQVMANLLSNAAKFSPENETVEISVARHHGDTLRISVTDHGSGIPEKFQPKLFERFTQSDSSDTRQKGGTGLGLSITKVIVEKHGGRIDFVSREGIGATFYIELPEIVGELPKYGDEAFRDLSVEEHCPCILIVEDDPDVAALMQRMLAEDGYNSDVAYDADEARQRLNEKAGQYKAITLDLVLPGEDGISLLEDLRRKAATHDIPVVVVSVKADEAKRTLNGGAVGVIDWLKKPIDQQRLISAVKQAAKPGRLPRVLHVEDEDDVSQVVSVMLGDSCDLTRTINLAESKEILDSETFDLVLLDVRLPDGSGLDLLETIEQSPKPAQVVIFSAYDVSQEYADKVSAVLVKSKTDNFKLTRVINSLLGNNADDSDAGNIDNT